MASCHQTFNILKPNMSVLQAEDGTGRILIARVMHGGAADRSGLIAVGDEVIEVSLYTLFPCWRSVTFYLLTYLLYRTSGVIFFHRLLHSYTRHIERVKRGERDIMPSTQD